MPQDYTPIAKHDLPVSRSENFEQSEDAQGQRLLLEECGVLGSHRACFINGVKGDLTQRNHPQVV